MGLCLGLGDTLDMDCGVGLIIKLGLSWFLHGHG